MTNDAAATDIVPAPGEHVMGVLYDVPESALAKMDKIEGVRADGSGNYRRSSVDVTAVRDNDTVTAMTYIGTDAGRRRFRGPATERQKVKPNYFAHLLTGAQLFDFSDEYLAYLRRQAGLPA